MDVMMPSQLIAAFIAGKIPYDSLPDSAKSALRLRIYRLAVQVIEASPAARAAMTGTIPAPLLELVKKEAQRIHRERKKT